MPPLLVIVPDRISDVVAKGEYQPRYYNPGNLFDEVHILMCNDDRVDARAVQSTAGDAKLHLHNLPEDQRHFIQRTRWFQPWLLQPWAKPVLAWVKRYQLRLLNEWAMPAVELARQIRPALIRCHGNDYNAYVAARIKRQVGVPFVVSLHSNPDAEPRRRVLDPAAPWNDRLFAIFFDEVEAVGVCEADLALPVYESIVPYLSRVHCNRYEVAYNVLNGVDLKKKESYALHAPVRLISVGRHFEYKNPENIIRAVAELPGTHLTLVGDGPYQERLQAITRECKVQERVTFCPAIPNAELCRTLPEYDIFVVHNEFWGISKAMLEALLTGMPAITNHTCRNGQRVPEMQGDFVMPVDNTKEGYRGAIHKLVVDDRLRAALGSKAWSHAQAKWAPAKTEARYVEIYKRVMANHAAGPGVR